MSEAALFEAIDVALRTYQTEDLQVVLKRLGKGICPKSFPVTQQSLYFLDIYYKTHGGEYGTDLVHLPNSGGVLDQPNLFFVASDIIARVRSRYFKARLDEDKNKTHVSGGPDNPGGSAQGSPSQASFR